MFGSSTNDAHPALEEPVLSEQAGLSVPQGTLMLVANGPQ